MSDAEFKALTKAQLLKRMKVACERLAAEMSAHDDSKFARGLSSEGYAGGFRQALDDVEALLVHGCPTDSRGYWRKERP